MVDGGIIRKDGWMLYFRMLNLFVQTGYGINILSVASMSPSPRRKAEWMIASAQSVITQYKIHIRQ